MLSFSAARALAAAALLAFAAPAAAQAIDFNCPGVGPNSVIRLRPCFNNQMYVTGCYTGRCGNGQAENVVFAPLGTGEDAKFSEWRIQLSVESPGHVRLTNMGTGSTGNFLVANAEQTLNGVRTRGTKSMSYADDPGQSVWRWDLRAARRACRVMLNNRLANKRLGKPDDKWPKINNLEVPVSSYQPTEEVTNDIFEVELVNAPAPVPTPAPAPAAYVPPAAVPAPAAYVPPPAQAPSPAKTPPPAQAPAPAQAPPPAFTNTVGGVANGGAQPNNGWTQPAAAPVAGDAFDLSDLFPIK